MVYYSISTTDIFKTIKHALDPMIWKHQRIHLSCKKSIRSFRIFHTLNVSFGLALFQHYRKKLSSSARFLKAICVPYVFHVNLKIQFYLKMTHSPMELLSRGRSKRGVVLSHNSWFSVVVLNGESR